MARPKKTDTKETETKNTGASFVDTIQVVGKTAFTPFGPAKIVKQEGDIFYCEYADKTQQKIEKSKITLAK